MNATQLRPPTYESELPAAADVEQVADVLRHLYDYGYLARHRILAPLRELVGDDPALAVQKLRSLFLATIEELRPRPDSPSDSLAWLPYQVLYNRYVLCRELDSLVSEFGICRRQIQRYQRRGVEEVASRLRARRLAEGGSKGPDGAEELSEEIARAATKQQAFDAVEQMEKAWLAVGALAQSHGTELSQHIEERPLAALGSPLLFRQLLVSALSLLIRLSGVGALAIRMERHGRRILCTLTGTVKMPNAKVPASLVLPSTLRALAKANGAEIVGAVAQGQRSLTFSMPAADNERVIAIVEDNHDLVALFSHYLSRRGYRLIEIGEPQDAIERIMAAQPDAVVLDVMMSTVDGWEILQTLRADPQRWSLPVIVCTVLDEPELASSLGANAYLRKPVRPAQLLECLARIVPPPHSVGVAPGSATPGSAPSPRP